MKTSEDYQKEARIDRRERIVDILLSSEEIDSLDVRTARNVIISAADLMGYNLFQKHEDIEKMLNENKGRAE